MSDQRSWDDVAEEFPLPATELPVTYKRVILNAAAAWDFFPGHHDPEYARTQGRQTIYLDTMFFQAFVDRMVTDYFGPQTFIARRQMRSIGSAYAGDCLRGEGSVRRRYTDRSGRPLVEIDISVATDAGVCCTAVTTALIPRRGESSVLRYLPRETSGGEG